MPPNNSIKIIIRPKISGRQRRKTKERKSEKDGSPKGRKSDQRCAEPRDIKKKEQESQQVTEINRLARFLFGFHKALRDVIPSLKQLR